MSSGDWKRVANFGSSLSRMEGYAPENGGSGISTPEDPFSLSALMNFDFTELCSPSASADQAFSSFWASFASTNASSAAAPAVESPVSSAVTRNQKIDFQFGCSSNSPEVMNLEMDRPGGCLESDGDPISKSRSEIVPRYLPSFDLSEKMLRALSFLKESSSGGILAQVWMPIKHGDDFVLSTSEQPYLLDKILAGYREVSRTYTFSARETPGQFPGIPGRVFMSEMPEWTSNVVYYKKFEYLRVNFAVNHSVRSLLAVPVFEPIERSCRAVLELVSTTEKPDFHAEMDTVCRALAAVDLRTVKVQTHQQNLSKNQKCAFGEIFDVLRAVCHAHMLPLALTWIPIFCDKPNMDSYSRTSCEDENSGLKKKNMLCVQSSACYVNDTHMEGFLHACAEHHLERGQGIAGKALLSNHPFFSPDVKGYDIRDYPLAHHARKYGLQAAVAIRLRSTYTGNDDYILEFFLPVNCGGSAEQQLLLNNLSRTMQRICRSLRTVSDAEIAEAVGLSKGKESGPSSSSVDVSSKNLRQIDSDTELTNFEIQNIGADEWGEDAPHDQMKPGPVRQLEKKRSTAEKNISLSVLQRYFSGSLKDAAKSIGVCPTTLKRICRQHGISRWPSRKINKVNRSLKKIQNVINSVQGVEGSLKYDPATGSLVAAVSPSKKSSLLSVGSTDQDLMPDSSSRHIGSEQMHGKMEHNCFFGGNSPGQLEHLIEQKSKPDDACVPLLNCCPEHKPIPFSGEAAQQGKVNLTTSWELYSGSDPRSSDSPKMRSNRGADRKSGLSLEARDLSRSSVSLAAADEMAMKMDVNHALKEHNHQSSSGMTDSTSDSASSCPSFKKRSKRKPVSNGIGAAITVKATYKEDTVRFKFSQPMGFQYLLDEIGKRFKLVIGTFQLKYMDDEDEWVMLSNDSDLQECVEVLESMGSNSVKLLVRDVTHAVGSSASSNCLLTET